MSVGQTPDVDMVRVRDAQARRDRIRRADAIEDFAQRLACSPVAAEMWRSLAGNSFAWVRCDDLSMSFRSLAAQMIDDATKTRREAEADPPAEVKP